jgi:hypothetical protein
MAEPDPIPLHPTPTDRSLVWAISLATDRVVARRLAEHVAAFHQGPSLAPATPPHDLDWALISQSCVQTGRQLQRRVRAHETRYHHHPRPIRRPRLSIPPRRLFLHRRQTRGWRHA